MPTPNKPAGGPAAGRGPALQGLGQFQGGFAEGFAQQCYGLGLGQAPRNRQLTQQHVARPVQHPLFPERKAACGIAGSGGSSIPRRWPGGLRARIFSEFSLKRSFQSILHVQVPSDRNDSTRPTAPLRVTLRRPTSSTCENGTINRRAVSSDAPGR